MTGTAFVTRTPGDVVSEILMSRSAFAGSFLVLEGVDDVKFWKTRAVPRNDCQFVMAGSKTTVTEAILRTEALKQAGVLGIIDDDCDSLLGLPLPSMNLIRTETRDMETLMLRSIAFDKVISELGNGEKIHALEQREGKSVREAFISRAHIFGQIRLLNASNNWLVKFDHLRPYRFADIPSWSFDRSLILQEVLRQLPSLTITDLESHLATLPIADTWKVLHGKDSLSVLAVGLRNVIGNQQHPAERIMQMLRLAFDKLLFEATQLYSTIKSWEADNQPYRILPLCGD